MTTSYLSRMSFADLLRELPGLSLAERQELVRCALDLDDPGLSPAEEELVDQRLNEHRRNPGTALGLEDIKGRLRSRLTK
jgi:hypothetical protein